MDTSILLQLHRQLSATPIYLSNLCQASPKRLKDAEGEGDSKVDGSKSSAEAKLNDVSESKAEEKAPEGGQLTANKVRRYHC